MRAREKEEADPTVDGLVGSIVGRRYRIDERVGSGGFGCVYAAWHLTLGVRVALKVLTVPPNISARKRAELVSRFLQEAKVLTLLKHANVVSALDRGTLELPSEAGVVPYLVTQWCAGNTLRDRLREKGRLTIAEAYDILDTLADALAHAHAIGVVHRDIKPSNVMMGEPGRAEGPKLIDFGVAKLASGEHASAPVDGTETTQGARAFTPAYAAPEQIAGATTGPATDVHALGLLFVELVTGEPPYGVLGDPNLLVIDPIRPSAESRGIATGAFETVIAKAVALKQRDRFANAADMRDALRAAAVKELGEGHQVPSARRAPAGHESAPPQPRPPSSMSEDATEPASGTRPAPPAPLPRARPRAPWIGAGSAAIVLAAAVVVGLALPRQPSRSRLLQTRSSGAIAPSGAEDTDTGGPFCSLSARGQQARLEGTGLTLSAWQKVGTTPTPIATLEDGADSVFVVSALSFGAALVEPREDAARAAAVLRSAIDGLELVRTLSLAYAKSGSCLLYVRGPVGGVAQPSRILDALLAGSPAEIRGDTRAGVDPLAAAPGPEPPDPAPAKTLGGLSRQEFIERVLATGARVNDATRREDDEQLHMIQLSTKQGDTRGRITFYRSPYARLMVTRTIGASEGRVFYAFDGQISVVAEAMPDPTLLSSVVKGLGTPIGESSR